MTDATPLAALTKLIRDELAYPTGHEDDWYESEAKDIAAAVLAAVAEPGPVRDEMLTAMFTLGIEKMKEALEFYGDPDTWFAVALLPDRPCGDIIEDYSEHGAPDYDEGDQRPGKRAREALDWLAAPSLVEPSEPQP